MMTLKQIPTSELARFLGVSMPYVSNVKSGRQKISTDNALRIHAEFGIPLSELRPDVYPPGLFHQLQHSEAAEQ